MPVDEPTLPLVTVLPATEIEKLCDRLLSAGTSEASLCWPNCKAEKRLAALVIRDLQSRLDKLAVTARRLADNVPEVEG